MELIAWPALWLVSNAVVMALIVRNRARRLRDWQMRVAESLLVQARASGAALLCVAAALLGVALLPEASTDAGLIFVVAAAVFLMPYYVALRRYYYLLTRSQGSRGRGVARGHVRGIVNASFGWLLPLYGLAGVLLWAYAQVGHGA